MSFDTQTLKFIVTLAGVGQIILAIGSIAIPGILKWREDVNKLRPLTRQIFWTYASYILMANFSFGLLSVLLPGQLLDGSPLAIAVTGFIAFYWLTRLIFQFGYFDRTDMPKGLLYTLGEMLLVGGFCYFLFAYCIALYHNLQS